MRLRDLPEAKIGLHLIICYSVNCLSAALSLAGVADGGCKPPLQTVSLFQLLLGSIPRSSGYPEGSRPATVPGEGHCNPPLPCLFSSVFAPLARAATRHVSLQSHKSQRGTAEEGGRRGKKHRQPLPALPRHRLGRSGEPSCAPGGHRPRGSGSHLSSFPLGVGPGGALLCLALPARPRPRREI